MPELINFLNQNEGAFSLLFAGLVAVATLVTAYLTTRLVAETKRMREAQTEPKISVTVQPREQHINFVDMRIQNIGMGPAYDVTFQIHPDFEYKEGKRLSQLGFAKNGIKYFAPNQTLQFYLTNMVEDYESKIATSIGMRISYYSAHSKKAHVDCYSICFSELEGLRQGERSPLYKINESIDKLTKEVKKTNEELRKRKA